MTTHQQSPDPIPSTQQADAQVEERGCTPAPRLSIILCTYNRCSLVLSALASLRRQTLPYEQFEVIVVDNGSTDGTLSAVRTYVNAGAFQGKKPEHMWRVQCLEELQNGLAYARNTGLLAASGDIVVFLDDDTLADPHFLERLLTAYEETGADAIGGRVELRWEAQRPHWLTDELLDMLGYFAPARARILLPESASFSSSSFSVKIAALRSVGSFSPFLSKRLSMPNSRELDDLCRRLRQAGYTLWYEPTAIVTHRASAARLKRPFFVGRAYWQGRSEVLTQYAETSSVARRGGTERSGDPPSPLRATEVLHEFYEIAYIALIHRPLLFLANKSTNEQLMAMMAQARSWGRLQQRLELLAHAPAEVSTPAVLLVRPTEKDAAATLLAQGLLSQGVYCTSSIAAISLSWLWRHRAYQRHAIGIVHFYRPGAFNLTHWQRQRLWFLLWLAQQWDIRIVTTDTGGWWQNVRSLRFLARRSFERKLLNHSDIVLAYTRQPEQLYPDRTLRRRVRSMQHPGFRGYYPLPLPRDQAHEQLGLPQKAGFTYLCLAHAHSERELTHLIDVFSELGDSQQKKMSSPEKAEPQLLLIGSPKDKKLAAQLLKRAALNPTVHLFMTEPTEDDIPLYLGAANAIVLPYLAMQSVGVLETAMLALSYERVVIAPDLPRFRDMLPPRMCLLYDPPSRASLVKALLKAQRSEYRLKEKDAAALDAKSGWEQYAHHLVDVYKQLLSGK